MTLWLWLSLSLIAYGLASGLLGFLLGWWLRGSSYEKARPGYLTPLETRPRLGVEWVGGFRRAPRSSR